MKENKHPIDFVRCQSIIPFVATDKGKYVSHKYATQKHRSQGGTQTEAL